MEMDLSKLEHISTEGLIAMRDKCVELLEKRKTATLRRGAVGWFIDRNGDKRHIYVTRINSKTVSGFEVDPITRVRLNQTNWRVSPTLLNVVTATPARTSAPVIHRPTTEAEAVW
jgi:hypothetical protein